MSGDNTTRALAYDKHYRDLWEARRFEREDLESALVSILDCDEGGHPDGRELQFALNLLRESSWDTKRLLDYCCGTGMMAIYFGLCGASVCACDASRVAIRIGRRSAQLSGAASVVRFCVADVNCLPYASGSFDAVFCQSSLHIIADYPRVLPELARIMVPGGRAVFCDEPLGHNPLLEAVRSFRRRRYRDCGGRTLRLDDVGTFEKHFSVVRVYPFNLLLQAKTLFGTRQSDRCVRHLLRYLDRIDHRLLSAAPWLRKYCGKVVLECIK